MIVKIKNVTNDGWTYVNDVKKIDVINGYCIHNFINADGNSHYENVLKIKKDGELIKNTSVLFPTNYYLIDDSDKRDFSNDDIYSVKIILLYHKYGQNEDSISFSMMSNNPVYIINDSGRTLDSI